MNQSSNRWRNFFRIFLVLILLFNVYNGLISENHRFSQTSSWGTLWQGLFLTTLISWMFLETVNWYFQKTRVGTLPALFWGIATGMNGADFFYNFTKLFEVPFFDKIVHASGGFLFGIIAIIIIQRINEAYRLELPRLLFYYLLIATTNLAGIVYEIGELIGDKYFGSRNITGPFDTTEDLVFNNLGLTIVILIHIASKKLRETRAQKS